MGKSSEIPQHRKNAQDLPTDQVLQEEVLEIFRLWQRSPLRVDY